MANALITLVVSCVIICWVENISAKECPPDQELGTSDHGFIATCAIPIEPVYWNKKLPSNATCLCKKGYTFKTNEQKKCIPSQDCGKDCPPNTEFVMSGGGFRPTCAQPKRPDGLLDAYAPHKVCLCIKGYVYETRENEKCIPLKDCPKH